MTRYSNIHAKGTEQEIQTFNEVIQHYEMADEDLGQRRPDFDKKDELFRSYIQESSWPYQSLVFDPRVFTALFEKTARQFARKPKGRLVPREGGDSLGAKVSNELLNFQWDDVERVDSTPMLAKWAQMDQNARKYGASFGLCKWHYETFVDKNDKKRRTFYDGPNFIPWPNRDVLVNPGYSHIKNWIQLREYTTFQELEKVNDTAKSKPRYKNLDLLRDSMTERHKGGDRRDNNYQSKNLAVRGLSDQRGRDEVFKTIELITEYRQDRWITFAPKHGVVLRDIPNPYDHEQIPVVMLKYYPVDDDIYGLSEVDPIEKLQRGINALVCQYIDSINMGLYPILKIDPKKVQMHTLEWGPGNKWLMDDPGAVVAHEQGTAGIAEFASTYRFMVGALQEGMGEASAGTSNMVPGKEEKTATEVKDTAASRLARDNFNQIFLAESLKKQMMFWHKMNTQFMFSEDDQPKVVRIVDKDAARYFQRYGLNAMKLSDEAAELLMNDDMNGLVRPEELQTDAFPVKTKYGELPKFTMSPMGDVGFLLVEKEDLSGNYDYIADIESMRQATPKEEEIMLNNVLKVVTDGNISQKLAQEGYSIDTKQLLEDVFEKMGVKDPDKYFEKVQQGGPLDGNQTLPGGAGAAGQGAAGIGNVPQPGMAGGAQANAGGQAQALMG